MSIKKGRAVITIQEERAASLGYRVSLLARLKGCILDRKIADLEICHGQIAYLMETILNEGQPQERLAEIVLVDRAATTRALKCMETSGLVTRRPNPENRRQKLVYPTQKGREVMDELLNRLTENTEMMFEGFSPEERKLFLAMMDRIIGNAKKIARCPGKGGAKATG